MYKQDLALKNLLLFISHKTQIANFLHFPFFFLSREKYNFHQAGEISSTKKKKKLEVRNSLFFEAK